MKKLFLIMIMCICLLLTACKTNLNAIDEKEIAKVSEEVQDAAMQSGTDENARADKSVSSEQNPQTSIKEENLLPDEKTPIEDNSPKTEEIPPLVPIENGVYRRTGSFEGLPLGYLTFTSRIPYNSMDEFSKKFNIEDYIIIRGVKKSDSTSVLTVKDSALIDWYSETPIEVLDAYYGDIKRGEKIFIAEKAVLLGEGENARIGCDDSTIVIKKNVEYILFLSKSDRKTEEGKTMYSCFAFSQSVYEIDEKLINQVLSNKEYASLAKDVYTMYYRDLDKLDRRIDVKKETQKLLSKSKADTLSAEQKQLLDKLSGQYGVK